MDEAREDQVSGLSKQVVSLGELVVQLQNDIKRNSYRRDYVARIFALVVIVAVVGGLAIFQQISNAQTHGAVVANCNAVNDTWRNQRVLYTALAAAERQVVARTVAEVGQQQARIQAYTQAANAIRLVNCDQLYG